MLKVSVFLERGKAAPSSTVEFCFTVLIDTLFGVSSSGMMKRNIIKKLGLKNKKWGLSLILAGMAALNVGFTNQVNAIEKTEIAQIEAVDKLPTQVASVAEFSSLNDTKIEINDIIDENINASNYAEDASVEESVVEKSYSDDGDYVAVLTMEATAYLPSDGDGYGITATGIPATYGVAAVDPYVIPLGSRLYIPGYGEAIAADTGGAIYGNRIDLCMESYSEAMQFGRRDVTVYVLR